MARTLSAQDEKRIEAFISLISDHTDAEQLHDTLQQLYFDYSQLLTEDQENQREGCSGQLYRLSMLIMVLDGKNYLNPAENP